LIFADGRDVAKRNIEALMLTLRSDGERSDEFYREV
jgi:hypothetical protein